MLLYTDCYIQIDLQSCLNDGVTTVQIQIQPYGPIRTHHIDEYYHQICHPMKCIDGSSSDDVSIIARAILDNHEYEIATQPKGFHKYSPFYRSLEKCYHGTANVTVSCPTAVQAGFYSLSKNSTMY